MWRAERQVDMLSYRAASSTKSSVDEEISALMNFQSDKWYFLAPVPPKLDDSVDDARVVCPVRLHTGKCCGKNVLRNERFCKFHTMHLRALEHLKSESEKQFLADRAPASFVQVAFFRRKIMSAYHHTVVPLFDDNIDVNAPWRWWNMYPNAVKTKLKTRANIASAFLSDDNSIVTFVTNDGLHVQCNNSTEASNAGHEQRLLII